MSTIINLAQNFIGSNNINLLQPIGQFGTRLHGGKDAASPRYIPSMHTTVAYTVDGAQTKKSVCVMCYPYTHLVLFEWTL